MKTFRKFITEEKHGKINVKPEQKVMNFLKKYNIPDDTGVANYGIDFSPNGGKVQSTDSYVKIPIARKTQREAIPEKNHPSVNKLLADIEKGAFKHPRLISYNVGDTYRAGQTALVIYFANRVAVGKPDALYHWTKTANVDSILKNGLKPSSGDWVISGSKVAYVATFLTEKPKRLARVRGFTHFKEPTWTLLKVDPGNSKLYVDEHRFDPDPINWIIYDVISKDNIEVMENIKANRQIK